MPVASGLMTQVSWPELAEIVGKEHLRAATAADAIDGVEAQMVAEPGDCRRSGARSALGPRRGREGVAAGRRHQAGLGKSAGRLRSGALDRAPEPRPRIRLGRHDGHRRSGMPRRRPAEDARRARPAAGPRPAVAGAGHHRRHPLHQRQRHAARALRLAPRPHHRHHGRRCLTAPSPRVAAKW